MAKKSLLSEADRQWAAYTEGWRGLEGYGRKYALRNLPRHLEVAGRLPDLRKLLLDLEFAEARLWAVESPQGYTKLFAPALKPQPDEVERAVIRVFDQKANLFERDRECFLQEMQNGLRQRLESEAVVDRLIAPVPRRRNWLRLKNRPPLRSAHALLRTLEGHTGGVRSVAVDGARGVVVSGSGDKTVKIWDLESGSELYSKTFDSIPRAAFRPDGIYAVCFDGGAPQIWDFQLELVTIRDPTA